MKISIADEIRRLCPGAALGVLHYKADVTESSEKLLAVFERKLSDLSEAYTMENIAKNPHIDATRQVYRALGKSPHEYRSAAEAMLRRIVKSASLYHINNVVEVNNYISVASGYAIGSYDLSNLRGDIELRRAMIQNGKHESLSVLYGFDDREEVTLWTRQFASMLEEYCGVHGIETWVV